MFSETSVRRQRPIRGGRAEAPLKTLSAVLRRDERLVGDPADIEAEHLPTFASWQRTIDAAFGVNSYPHRAAMQPEA